VTCQIKFKKGKTMKYLKMAAVFSLVFLFAATLQSAAPKTEIKFAKMPTVKAAGNGQAISFELTTPCDVEVAILDSTGRAIRHLAAGVLGGENVPPAPLQPGLVQVLQWDGLDDFGKKGVNGPFKFLVRAGIDPKLGGFIGDDPYTFGAFTDIQSDEDGNIYIIGDMGTTNQRSRSLRVFDANGRYLRELMPFPATVPPGGMKDVAIWDEEYECWRPRNLSCLNPEFYADSLTFIGASKEHGLLFTDLAKFYELNSDGSVKGAAFKTRDLAQIWPKEFHHWGGLAEDGRRNWV